MKLLRKIHVTLAGTLLLFMSACRENDINILADLPVNKTSVNSWIYELMRDGYFWYDQLPSKNGTDSSLAPEEYFEKLVYNRQTHDRFSMITNDYDVMQQQFNGITRAFGFHYMLAYTDPSKTKIAAFLSHVSNGSPAETAGLRRGDIITKINETELTENNYNALFGSGETIRLSLGNYDGATVTADNSRSVSLTKAQISASPVAFSSVISKQNKKVGYVVYTQFVPGTDKDKTLYDDELRSIFAGFKNAGITELVLDLRLNGGGYISSAITLSSLIVSNYSPSKVFYKEQWNDKYIKYWEQKNGPEALTYKFTAEQNNVGNRLNRVFVLTSQGTASASELIINGLKPYMQVVTIGDHTAGKNLFGSLIPDEKKRWKYGLYLMLGQTVNARGESDYGTVHGILPTQFVDDSKVPFRPFGDENETLLQAALSEMGLTTGNSARLGSKISVQKILPAAIRDTPAAWDQKMIRDQHVFPALID